jgi:glyoxylase-like metal-dependent hydrolase (beta-lactamase superfamily II)
MTLDGTNGYVVDGGHGRWIAIDPGPDLPEQTAAFVDAAAAQGAQYAAILVTHGHPDHFPGAAPLARATGAPVYAHPEATFAHDRELADGETIAVDDASLRVVHAPGHARDHVVVALADEAALFTGDVIIGTGTVVVAPPQGDMRAYQRTLRRLRDEFGSSTVIYGGHGPERTDVADLIDGYIAHREAREAALLAALAAGSATIPELVATIYRDIDRHLWPAAARQLLAYLIALEREGRVRATVLDVPLSADQRALLAPDLGALDRNSSPTGSAPPCRTDRRRRRAVRRRRRRRAGRPRRSPARSRSSQRARASRRSPPGCPSTCRGCRGASRRWRTSAPSHRPSCRRR